MCFCVFVDGSDGKVLVLSPASVIENWEREIERWCKLAGVYLRVCTYLGKRNGYLTRIDSDIYRIVLTSYDTFRLDVNILSECKWEIVILDEIHKIKGIDFFFANVR